MFQTSARGVWRILGQSCNSGIIPQPYKDLYSPLRLWAGGQKILYPAGPPPPSGAGIYPGVPIMGWLALLHNRILLSLL